MQWEVCTCAKLQEQRQLTMYIEGLCPNALGQEAMPVIIHGSSTAAVHSNNVGVGYSGSGFLIFYFVGKHQNQASRWCGLCIEEIQAGQMRVAPHLQLLL